MQRLEIKRENSTGEDKKGKKKRRESNIKKKL